MWLSDNWYSYLLRFSVVGATPFTVLILTKKWKGRCYILLTDQGILDKSMCGFSVELGVPYVYLKRLSGLIPDLHNLCYTVHKIVTLKLQFAHFGKIGYNALPECPHSSPLGIPSPKSTDQPKVFKVGV